jgi:AcrR family transcriptional regulator
MPNTITPIARGLRERKKQKTRESIQREAMRLIGKQGYDQTTIEQIAAAVEISPSTFFNYFPSKEDVVLYDAYDPVLASLFSQRPADEPLSVSFRRVLEAMSDIFERDHAIILARGRLWFEVPSLRARLWEEVEKAQVLMSTLVAERSGRAADDFETRVVVMVMVAAAMEAMREWLRRGGKGSFVTLVNQALELVDAGDRLDKIASPTRIEEPRPRSSSPPTGRE